MRASAQGNLKKLVWLVVVVVVGLVVLTWLTPFSQGYELKTACKLMCNDMIRAKQEREMAERGGSGPPAFDDKNVREGFLNRARQAGVRFDGGDWDADCGAYLEKDRPHCFSHKYSYDAQNKQHICKIHVRYRSDTAPALIGDVLQELPHLKMQHHIDVDQRVNATY